MSSDHSFLTRYIPHLGRLGRATRWRRSRGRPRVWAHRGASAHAPENTMRAFELAQRVRADGLEFDVRFDGEHNVVVFHDETLERLCNRPGRIDRLTAAERAHLRVGGEPIPTLAEVLDGFPDLELDIEIKSDRTGRSGALVDAVANVVADHRRQDRLLVTSFDPFVLLQFHRRLPDISLGYIFHDEQALPMRRGWIGRWFGVSIVHPQHTLCTPERVKAWHVAGQPVNAWTVDDPEELRRLAELHVDGVFSNDPAQALKILAPDL